MCMDIKKLFDDMQNKMFAEFDLVANLPHPVSKGDATEAEWFKWFENNFPTRYKAERAFVIDYEGNTSEQLDIVIYDTYYSPIIFEVHEQKYISIESVYAVFEVKQELNKEHIDYAKKKIASVRNLKRTNGEFMLYDGRMSKKNEPLPQIIGGLLTLRSGWADKNTIKNIEENVADSKNDDAINFICCLEVIACEIKYDYESSKIDVISNKENGTLLYTYFKLLRMLQSMGNAPAIDYKKYGIED